MRDIHLRYYRQFAPAMICYVAVMLLAWPLLHRVGSTWLKSLIALLPMLPTLFLVRAMVRLVRDSDEFEQRVHLIALGIASTLVGTLSLAVGFLAAAHVLDVGGDALVWVFPGLVFSYGVARNWANRRYGVDGSDECGQAVRFLWVMIGVFAALAMLLWPWIDRATSTALFALIGALVLGASGFGVRRWLARRRIAATP